MSCLNPLHQRLSGFALGELERGAALELLAHAELCASCSRDLDAYADLVTVGTSALVRPVGALERWRARLPRVVFVLCAGFVLLGVVDQLIGPSQRPSYAALAERAVPGAPADFADVPFGEELAAALEGWSAGEYAAVAARLDAFLDLHPDHARARFHRAIARRELGRPEAARADLRVLADAAQGALREEALWSLANLELASDDPASALAALDRLAAARGELAPRAAALSERVRAAR